MKKFFKRKFPKKILAFLIAVSTITAGLPSSAAAADLPKDLQVLDPVLAYEYASAAKVDIGTGGGKVNLADFVPGSVFTVEFEASTQLSGKSREDFRFTPLGSTDYNVYSNPFRNKTDAGIMPDTVNQDCTIMEFTYETIMQGLKNKFFNGAPDKLVLDYLKLDATQFLIYTAGNPANAINPAITVKSITLNTPSETYNPLLKRFTVYDPILAYDNAHPQASLVKINIGTGPGELNLDDFVPGSIFTVTLQRNGNTRGSDQYRIIPFGVVPYNKRPGTGVKAIPASSNFTQLQFTYEAIMNILRNPANYSQYGFAANTSDEVILASLRAKATQFHVYLAGASQLVPPVTVTGITLTKPAPPPAFEALPAGNNGIAARYSGDYDISNDSNVLFYEDFESYNVGGVNENGNNNLAANGWTGMRDPDNLSITDAMSHSGTQSAKLFSPQGGPTTEELQKNFAGNEQDTLYLRYYEYIDPSFNVTGSSHNGSAICAINPEVHGGIVMSSSGIKSDGYNHFEAMLEYWRGNTSVPYNPGRTNFYSYNPDQSWNYGDHYYPSGARSGNSGLPYYTGPNFTPRVDVYPERGKWYCYEYMIEANTVVNGVPQRNGRMACWVDGKLVMDYTDMVFRYTEDLKINLVRFCFLNANNPNDTMKYIDDIVVAKSYIGPRIDMTGIKMVTAPSKVQYTAGQTLDLTGMVLNANYSDGSTKKITSFETNPANGTVLNDVGSRTVTVSYTESNATWTEKYNIMVVPPASVGIDALPEGNYGIAAQHPNDHNIINDSNVLFYENFESYNIGRVNENGNNNLAANGWTGMRDPDNLYITDTTSYSGTKSAELFSPKGGPTIQELQKNFKGNEQDTMFLRFYEYIDPSFDVIGSSHNGSCIAAINEAFHGGIFMSSAGIKADGYNHFETMLERWRGLATTKSPGRSNFYSYFPGMSWEYGDHFYPDGSMSGNTMLPNYTSPNFTPGKEFYPDTGKWYCYEYMLKSNTMVDGIPQPDGRMAAWVNGELIMDIPDMVFRYTEDLKINLMRITFLNATNPNDTMKYVDDIVVAKSYIGPRVGVTPAINGISASTINLSSEGGSVTLNVTGEYLQYADSVQVFDGVTAVATNINPDGTEATYVASIPANTSTTNIRTYTFMPLLNGENTGYNVVVTVARASGINWTEAVTYGNKLDFSAESTNGQTKTGDVYWVEYGNGVGDIYIAVETHMNVTGIESATFNDVLMVDCVKKDIGEFYVKFTGVTLGTANTLTLKVLGVGYGFDIGR